MNITPADATPEPASGIAPYSHPGPGFADEAARRQAALIFASMGIPPQWMRSRTCPADRLLRELADEVDAVLAEGLTPEECRDLYRQQGRA